MVTGNLLGIVGSSCLSR